MTDQTVTAPLQEHRFPCEQCGAEMSFSPDRGQLICGHCGNVSQVLAAPAPWGNPMRELDLRKALANQLAQEELEETRVTSCPNCAAQISFVDAEHATRCPFCDTPVVTDTGLHRHIKPRGVLPFALTQNDARSAVGEWLGTLWFAPNGLKEYARKNRAMQGIYVPYWTYDADTKSTYTGARGTIYYETRTVIRNGQRETVQVPRIHWTPVSGRVARFFDDVLVLASKSLPKRFTDALEPWDLAALEPYRPEYLAGFGAEGYTVPLEDGFAEARLRMDQTIARDVRFDIGGDQQQIHNLRTELGTLTFKHILLPVWVAAYKYRGKTYRFVVNGRTGRVQGERPWSAWKLTFAITLGLITAACIGYAIANAQGVQITY